MKFFADYFGCRCNQAEVQDWIIQLENVGYRYTNSVSEADFALLNTCSVTERSEKKVLRYLAQNFRETRIPWIITGCTVAKEKSALAARYRHYFFFDNQEKTRLVERVKEIFSIDSNVVFHSAFKSRVFLKVQDGCNFRCTFCIVPSLRGQACSLPLNEAVAKARYYSSLGYREIVLTGINLSSYGYDLFPRRTLLELIAGVQDLRGVDIVRLSSLDPRYLSYGWIKELSRFPKIAESFHFSLQSGSDTVLRRMHRPGCARDLRHILDLFREFYPQANLGADIIVGFPEETEKEFAQTLRFIEESPLNYLHIFPFSLRRGTKAEALKQVAEEVKNHRLRELKELNIARRLEYREMFLDKVLPGIMIDEDENYSLAVTKNFLMVRIPPLRGFRRKKIRVQIMRVMNENVCEGRIVG